MLRNLKKKWCKKQHRKKPLRDVVLIFPYDTETNKILLIEEYIHHYGRSFWKSVSGGIDKKDKDNFTHAHEELAEELGMKSFNLYHFHSFERIFGARAIHCYVAENPILMKHPPKNPDTDIILKTKWVDESELWRMIDNKELIWNEGTMTAVQVMRKYKK